MPITVPINDLKRQNSALQPELEAACARVRERGWFILGPEVEAFEAEFAAYCGAVYCVGVANGTDAMEIGLRALGIEAGDEVITVANAGMYSTAAIRAVGAQPVFAEIDPSTNTMHPDALQSAITPRTRAVIVTHLYGRMAAMVELSSTIQRYGLAMVEDCAQAHGASYDGVMAGSWGDVGCFSFYPTKNLGALGDAGAILTSDERVAQRARQLRQYGWTRKYESHLSGGRNSRLDELQAAFLRAKLPHLETWNQERARIAGGYQTAWHHPALRLPAPSRAGECVYHLYVVRNSERDRLRAALHQKGVGCDVHYPIPDHLQLSCADLGYTPGALPETERAANEVLTLPCFPELTGDERALVERSLLEVLNG